MHPRSPLPCALLLLAAFTVAGAGANAPSDTRSWPQFRGPDALGHGAHPGLPDRWGTNQNVAWRIEVPGRGWSSPVVQGNRVFLTTAVSEGEMEPPKKGLYFGGERKEVPSATHRWLVLALDLETGREVWRREAHRGPAPNQLHVKNTYASETPVIEGNRLHAYFGNVGWFAYDLEGTPLWRTNWPAVKTRYGWGSAASPVAHDGRVFVVNDNDERSYLVALDGRTGRQLWRVDRDEKSNWATPYVWRNERRTELVTCGSRRVRSYDLEGRLLWELRGMSSIAIPTPFAGHGLLYVSSGYVGDRTRPVFAIRPGASGDISLQAGETNNAFIAWHQPAAGPYNPSPLLVGDRFYVLYDFGFLGCYDARTGRMLHDKERIREGRSTAFTASPWAANGKVFALSEDGDTYVFAAGADYRLLHVNSLEEMCMATPALAGDRLLIRTLTGLYCLRKTVSE
ncbi:MAG: hypothetical protein RJA22_1602 [Verrucomicrobiota bacterium]|jgi:outer membrane protein assembly factor BamB